jgi:transposase InsO family protein
MLTEQQLTEYCDRRGLSPAARGTIAHVRASQPSRRVRSGTKNVACRFASHKMEHIIQAESHRNELPAVIGWEYDDRTFEFYDQPPTIKVAYADAKGRRHAHLITPDFFVLEQNFTGWVECKTEEWLRAKVAEGSTAYVPDGPGRWRYPAGEEFAASVGLEFRMRSSAETNWTAVRNADFLADYLDCRAPAPTADQRRLVAAAFGDAAWIRLLDLLRADANLSADAIYAMLVSGDLYVNLARDLLAEPERTRVFRDAVAEKAYRIQADGLQLPAIPDNQGIKLEPGCALVWDGTPWHIVNVGENDIFLADDGNTITTLSRTALPKLLADGVIHGVPHELANRWSAAEEAVYRASPDGFRIALQRYYSIFPDRGDGTPPAGKERVVRKWRALYRKSAQLTGNGFVGLFPRTHLRGDRSRKLDPEVLSIMKDVIDTLYSDGRQGTQLASWGEVRNRCEARGFVPPSEKTFRAEVRRRNRHALQVAREGEKAAYDIEDFQWHLERTAPRHGERPFEVVHIDHTVLDLQFVGSRNGENLDKAWLTFLVDANTRMVLAWVVRFEEPSYRSCMSVIRECIRRHGRIGRYIVADKGSDFEGTYFEALLAFLESHKKTRPGGKPRFGAVIERLFGVATNEFVNNLIGNNQALQTPRRLSKTHDPRALAVWTLPEFNQALAGYLDRVYHAAEHPAHGMSPKQAMEIGLAHSGMRAHKLIPYSKELVIMSLPSTKKGKAKVDGPRGVKINYIYYWTEEFRNPAISGTQVDIRYDPDDASTAFAWIHGRWVPCRSEYAAEFQRLSERELMIATQELRARFKREGVRRAITASLLAEFLRSTAATEQLLTQRKRHQEAMAADDDEVKAMLTEGAPASHPAGGEDIWAGIAVESLGDLS